LDYVLHGRWNNRDDQDDEGFALVEVATLKTIGKLILGIAGVLLLLLPVDTVSKFLRRIWNLFRTSN
jgi:hypothetical protein